MPIHDFTSQRLFLDAPLHTGATIPATREQANYLCNVLRLQAGAGLLVFNGRDGEWRAELALPTRKSASLVIGAQARPQENGPDIHYLFAPLKRARLDYMVQKAVELGVRHLAPVLTRHTVAERVNTERMRANVIEAAEQCGILRLPSVADPEKLPAALARVPADRTLIVCDEAANVASPVAALSALPVGAPVAVLIGPEGGFAPEERVMLLARPGVVRLALGPRIMRADTAAVAALALVDAVIGDWR
jgi:16S rRNA (uracil1498-N3)-methyltransferase